MSKGKVGILTAGGDCAGLNAVIAACVKYGSSLGYEFIGFQRGYEGVLNPPDYRILTPDDVKGISHLGGTILHATNKGRFGAKMGEGDVARIPDDVLEEAATNLKALGCTHLVVIGGDGSLSGALQLSQKGVKVVGVPKTIDNDLAATDQTFGFSTAQSVAVEALDRVHTTATSHDRVLLVEVMGRNTGWIALKAGLAGGADAILVPEFEFSLSALVEYLRGRKAEGKGSAVVVVAEGARIGGQTIGDGIVAGGEKHYGGITNELMARINAAAPGEFEIRNTIIGHIQRGGAPNARDRNLARAYGVAAMDAIDQGLNQVMVSLRDGHIQFVSLTEAVEKLKTVDDTNLEYQTALKLGVFIHD
ncbi:MAG: ATP-dependent 6-phosphofructokinase [Fimbriimonadaceae bacterium]|nr:ATP-dependent 6-phosphofructokinase [Fimbriimonadaceae bacterium]